MNTGKKYKVFRWKVAVSPSHRPILAHVALHFPSAAAALGLILLQQCYRETMFS